MIAILFAALLPIQEMQMARAVAAEYKLDKEQTALLLAIRKFENGRPGLEFGIGESSKHHPAHRYTDGEKSFKLQARWAAGTIRRRYTGDLKAFARRYCPVNHKVWHAGVSKIIIQARKEVK